MTPAEALFDLDWRQVFGFAGSFTLDDVDTIEGESAGENDGPSWLVYGRLRDGRWFFIEAGCDYTGWNCVSDGAVWLAADRAELIRSGMGADARDRLGLTVAEAPRVAPPRELTPKVKP